MATKPECGKLAQPSEGRRQSFRRGAKSNMDGVVGRVTMTETCLGLFSLLPRHSLNLGQGKCTFHFRNKSKNEMRLPEEVEMLTPEPLEMKPHVYGKSGGGVQNRSCSHLSTN
jgi:hypothetical protein